jgi:hypothetical protein
MQEDDVAILLGIGSGDQVGHDAAGIHTEGSRARRRVRDQAFAQCREPPILLDGGTAPVAALDKRAQG